MKFKDSKIIVVVPVYNEEEIINNIITNLKKLINLNFKIIILNDGSTIILQKLEFFESDNRIIIIDKDNEGHGKTL